MGDMPLRCTWLFIWAAWMARSSEARPEYSIARGPSVANRSCTVDELLPLSTSMANSVSSEWSDPNTARDPYGCDCSFSRARYFCPSREKDKGYRQWVPRAVSEGVCNSVTRQQLSEAPLPPRFKVLVYGNSHLRQVVEALMCLFPDKVRKKHVSYTGVSKTGRQEIRGDATCRYSSDEDWATLVDHHCVAEPNAGGAGKVCSDDIGEFFMTDDAEVHFYMADNGRSKSIRNALRFHNRTPYWFYYDAVFANSGNPPYMSPESVLVSAFQLQRADVPFFWLSQYDGVGDISRWEASKLSRFHESGARFVDIRSMTHGLRSLTKGAVEPPERNQGSNVEDDSFSVIIGGDPHFCLPGPPDEMALLLLKLMWAVRQENI